MSTDAALAEYRAARQELFEASRERDRLATARQRYVVLIELQNQRIATARTRLNAARTALQQALQTDDTTGAAVAVANGEAQPLPVLTLDDEVR